ncbi:MAG: hypothetical protein AABY13_02405, partial [Nanoarchaeota archaeon]
VLPSSQLLLYRCRDYREELCTKDGTVAVCRQNRWWDCWSQTSASSCENTAVRDCMWDADLVTTGGRDLTFPFTPGRASPRCIPLVSPGLQHWRSNARKVCELGNEQVREGIGVFSQALSWTPPITTSNGQAQFCYAMGDCGNKQNIVGFSPRKQYKASTGQPDASLATTNLDQTLTLPKDVPPFAGYGITTFDYPPGTKDSIDQVNQDYLNWGLSLDPIAVILDQVELHIDHTTLCKLWKGPKKPNLQKCGQCDDALGGCSEYVCKSLGTRCAFSWLPGQVPHCALIGTQSPLQVTLSFPKHTVTKNGDTYTITTSVNPYESIPVDVTTDKPSVCAISPLPRFDDVESDDPLADFVLDLAKFGFSNTFAGDIDTAYEDIRDPALEQHFTFSSPDLEFLGTIDSTSTVSLVLGKPGNLGDVLKDKYAQQFANDPVMKDKLAPAIDK